MPGCASVWGLVLLLLLLLACRCSAQRTAIVFGDEAGGLRVMDTTSAAVTTTATLFSGFGGLSPDPRTGGMLFSLPSEHVVFSQSVGEAETRHVAGSRMVSGASDGSGYGALLSSPRHMLFLADLNVTLLVDQSGCLIRLLDSRNVTSFVGSSSCGGVFVPSSGGLTVQFVGIRAVCAGVPGSGMAYLVDGDLVLSLEVLTGTVVQLFDLDANAVALGVRGLSQDLVIGMESGAILLANIAAAATPTLFAGDNNNTLSLDGVGVAARFRLPIVLPDPDSDLVYIIDTCPSGSPGGDMVSTSVRSLDAAGSVVTLAGAYQPADCAAASFSEPDGVGLSARIGRVQAAVLVREICSTYSAPDDRRELSVSCAGGEFGGGTIGRRVSISQSVMRVTGDTDFLSSLTVEPTGELYLTGDVLVNVAALVRMRGTLTLAGARLAAAGAFELGPSSVIKFIFGQTNAIVVAGDVLTGGIMMLEIPLGGQLEEGARVEFVSWTGDLLPESQAPLGWINVGGVAASPGPAGRSLAQIALELQVTCSTSRRACLGVASSLRTRTNEAKSIQMIVAISVLATVLFFGMILLGIFLMRMIRRGFGPDVFTRMEDLESRRIEQIAQKRTRIARDDEPSVEPRTMTTTTTTATTTMTTSAADLAMTSFSAEPSSPSSSSS